MIALLIILTLSTPVPTATPTELPCELKCYGNVRCLDFCKQIESLPRR